MREILGKWKWQLFCLVLAIALATSISFNIFQSFNASNEGCGNSPFGDVSGQMNFTFTWAGAQKIVNGTFKIDVFVWFQNFTWNDITTETFNILVKVYDDDYSPNDCLGLVFDMNHNGKIDFGIKDEPIVLYADNTTVINPSLHPAGFLGVPEMPREKIFTCTYDTDEGYTFGPYRLAAGNVMRQIGDIPAYIPIHICFRESRGKVSFNFWVYTDKTKIPESPIYNVQITSVNATTVDQPVTIEGKITPPITFKRVHPFIENLPYAHLLTDKDGQFKKVCWFTTPGTYEVYAKLDNSTSNVVQVTVGE